MSRYLVLVLLPLATFQGGCQGGRSSSNPPGPTPLPTKDEVALVDGVPITLTAFERVRTSLPDADTDTVYWVTVAAAVLHAEAARGPRPIPIGEAVGIARYAAGRSEPAAIREAAARFLSGNGAAASPSPPSRKTVRERLDGLIRAANIKKNTAILSNLKYK